MALVSRIAKTLALKIPAIRRLVEQRNAIEEAWRAAVTQRDEAVTQRDEVEQARRAVVTQRDEAEQARQAAVTQRDEAEQARRTAVTQRDEADQARWAAVTQRDEAEQARWATVTQRDEAEQARWAAVTQRDEAEQARWAAVAQRKKAERSRAKLAEELSAFRARNPEKAYQILEGTAYARYAVPIDYLPSRDFRPRWGYSHPREPVLDGWFRSRVDQYTTLLNEMRKAAGKLAHIPRQFDEANLPLPAWLGVPYAPFDAVALYTMVQQYRPRTYLEIGSGITTCFAHKAIIDAGLQTKIVSIDPEPRAKIDAICARIERVGLETCDLTLFERLEPGDILLFDGSHRSFMNSDVTVFMIDVLPRLRPGVIVHVHDILLPFDYPESFKNWYWNEQYILAAYLMGHKDRIDPLLPTAFVCRDDAFASTDFTMVDLGDHNEGWRSGGAMWFTHTR